MAQDIRTVMTPDPATVEVNAALVDAARAMRDADITDRIVSLGDLAEQRDRGSVLGEVSAAPPNR
jgi:CBS domain-containing protein